MNILIKINITVRHFIKFRIGIICYISIITISPAKLYAVEVTESQKVLMWSDG